MILLVMGTTGSGKTTVGKMLAERLGWLFLDADDFHSPQNKEKMHRGLPLSDQDRAPWLAAIHNELLRQNQLGRKVVLACSALKREYREMLRTGPEVKFVYLKGGRELLHRRLHARVGHFMTEKMLESQLATLEEPHDAVIVDVDRSAEEIVAQIRVGLAIS